ncbi:MAG: oligoendopeptidase F, partial [Parcubacteria group bacterium Gr01-1014_70]
EKTWRGKITDASLPGDVLRALQEYEAIAQEAAKPIFYANVLHATDSDNKEHGALFQKTQAVCTEIENKLLFFVLELLGLSDDVLRRFTDAAELMPYKHYLKNLLQTKPHRLSEKEEQILNDTALTGPAAFVRLFEEEMSQKKFKVTVEGKSEEWSEEKVLDLLYDANREKREEGARALTAGLTQDLRRLAFIFNTLGHDKQIRDTYQKFQTPEEARHLANETTQEMVDTMCSAIRENISVASDYYTLKRDVLGFPELYDYDRYAPILETQRMYSFKEAEQVVLDAYGVFSPVLRERAEEFFQKNWIDAETRHGKRSGAFCSPMTPDTHPLVFLNYLGGTKHVLTLAHELGHGVHASLMRRHTLLNFDTPLTIAETASVFGEMLVFDNMRKTMVGKELLALTMGKREDIFATVFRQYAMYAFEQDFHKARRSEGELSQERISELWMNRQREMFGNSVILRNDYSIWWSYISHFLQTPFYVYAYAFGELLTLSFYNMYRTADDKTAFAKKYTDMLEAGGTKTPEELVEPFGIDLSSKEFWCGGISIIQSMVTDAKNMHNGLT